MQFSPNYLITMTAHIDQPEVSLIRDNQVREFKGNSLIIKGLDNQAMKSLIITDNQGFHHVSPKFSCSPDDSTDQAVNGIKI